MTKTRQRGVAAVLFVLLGFTVFSATLVLLNIEIERGLSELEEGGALTPAALTEQATTTAENYYRENPDYTQWNMLHLEAEIYAATGSAYTALISDEDVDSEGYRYRSLFLTAPDGSEIFVDGARYQQEARARLRERAQTAMTLLRESGKYATALYGGAASEDTSIHYYDFCANNTAQVDVNLIITDFSGCSRFAAGATGCGGSCSPPVLQGRLSAFGILPREITESPIMAGEPLYFYMDGQPVIDVARGVSVALNEDSWIVVESRLPDNSRIYVVGVKE